MIPSPRQLNLPHDEWRPGQYEAVRAIQDAKSKVVLLDAMVGSGKTAVGLALGSRGKSVRTLTFTKALQSQYANYPSTEALYGLNNYPCALLGGIFNADACAFAANMLDCHVAADGGCAYVNQRRVTKESDRQALSYPYYFLSSWPHKNDAAVDYLYCDEAHHMPQAIMSHMTLEVKPDQLSKMGMEPIPQMPEPQVARRALVLAWLEYTIDRGQQEIDRLNNIKEKSPGLIMKIRYMTNLIQNSRVTYAAMEENGDDFFIDLMDDGSLRIFPLTPAPFFWTLFNVDERTKIVPASATLGNHREFVKLLGIGSDWESHVVPPVYPPSSQPVYYYDDAPKMNYKSGPGDFKKQAELMIEIANKFPSSANGLIHFVSKEVTKKFAYMLSSKLGDRLWVPDERHSTEEKVAAWELQKKKNPGTICLSWSMHTGIDAPDVSWSAIQKVNYLPLDTLGKQLMERNPRLYRWLAAITVEQSCGRIRRGSPEHYEEPGQPLRKYVAVLDNHFLSLKSMYSSHFQDQLTRV